MLAVPILLLLPFALRAGVRSRHGLVLTVLLALLRRRRGAHAVALRAARPRLRAARAGLAVAPATAAAALRRARRGRVRAARARAGLVGLRPAGRALARHARATTRPRCTSSSSTSCSRCSTRIPCSASGLNTFSVYYEFLTGKTNWGPHSFYVALLDETGLVGACVFAAFLAWVGIRLAVILRASRVLERRGDARGRRVARARDRPLGRASRPR